MPSLLNTTMLVAKDSSNTPIYSIPFSSSNYTGLLTQNIEQVLIVPRGTLTAFFSYSPGSNVFVNINENSIFPTGNISPNTSVLNPVARRVAGGDVLHFICDTNCYISVSFYNGVYG